jgi:hypothetical protein
VRTKYGKWEVRETLLERPYPVAQNHLYGSGSSEARKNMNTCGAYPAPSVSILQ